jgi:hypothetical protein
VDESIENIENYLKKLREDINKDMKQFLKDFQIDLESLRKIAHDHFVKISPLLEQIIKDMGEKKIEIKIGENTLYKTSITATGDVISEFPADLPAKDDVYWTAYMKIVETVLQNRQTNIQKLLDKSLADILIK